MAAHPFNDNSITGFITWTVYIYLYKKHSRSGYYILFSVY